MNSPEEMLPQSPMEAISGVNNRRSVASVSPPVDADKLCKVIGYKSKITGKEIAAVFRHLPPGEVICEAIHHGQVQFLWEWLK